VRVHIRRDKRVLQEGTERTYVAFAHNIWEAGTDGKKRSKPVVFARLGAEEDLEPAAVRGMRDALDRLLEQMLARKAEKEAPAAVQVSVTASTVRKHEKGLRMLASREFGVRQVVEAVWRRLGLDEVLAGFAEKHRLAFAFERIVFGMVLNRMVDPASKRACNAWLQERAWFPEADGWEVHQFYRALDVLDAHAEELEDVLLAAARRRLPADELRLLLIDTTSSFFASELTDAERAEVEAEWAEHDAGERSAPVPPRPQVVNEPPVRMRGHSKDHRPDKPQVVIGLIAGAGGRVLRHRVYPGNRQDQTITLDLLGDVRQIAPRGRPVVVGDSGMGGEPNLRAIDAMEPRVDRITAVPLRSLKKAEAVLSRPGRWRAHPSKPYLTIRVVELEGSAASGRPERFIATRNARSADRSNRVLDRTVARVREQLARDDGVDAHGAPTCRLLSKPSHKRLVKPSADGRRLLLDTAAVNRERRLAGVRLLRTSLMDEDPADVVAAYQSLLTAEDDFRRFKGPLQLRPMHHRATRRIRAHVLVCVLGLVMMQEIERLTELPFAEVVRRFQGVSVARMRDGDREYWMRGEWPEDSAELLSKLGVRRGPRTWAASASVDAASGSHGEGGAAKP